MHRFVVAYRVLLSELQLLKLVGSKMGHTVIIVPHLSEKDTDHRDANRANYAPPVREAVLHL